MDKTVGSLKDLYKKSRVDKKKESIEFDENVKIDYDSDDEEIKRKADLVSKPKFKKKSVELEKSNHKEIVDEVPKWYKMTMDEAARLLIKHVCYFNVEQGLFALDKPYGLPSFGGPGIHLSVARILPKVKEILKIDYELYMMHRLDENTTGVMLFATNKEIEQKLRKMFNERKIIKQYLAITKFKPEIDEGEINIPLIEREVDGITKIYLSPEYNQETSVILDKPKRVNIDRKNAITKYRVLDSTGDASLIECQPETGIKHQIRVHLSFGLNCPILGDHKYSHHIKLAPQKLPTEMLKALDIRQSKVRYVPMHLHAYRLILPEFYKNGNVFVQAKLPLHFQNNLKRLKLFFK